MTVEIKKNPNREPFSIKNAKFRSTAAQIIAVGIKNTLLVSYGLTLGFPTVLIPGLQQPDPNDSFNLSQEAISWMGSIHYVCVPIACALSGPITQALGRKTSMLIFNTPFFIAWMILKFGSEVYLIFIALAITGLCGGLLEVPVTTYVAEVCQPRLRGILSSISSVAVISGVLIQFLFGKFMHWRTVALANSAFPIVSCILLCFVPESPHWLILKNRLPEAKKSIAWLRGWTTLEAVEEEFKNLCKYISNEENKPRVNAGQIKKSLWDTLMLFTKKNFLWPYGLVSFCFFLSHFHGMTTLQTYAIQIFASLKAPIDNYVATVYMGVAQLCGCIVCVATIHRLGKRTLTFISLIGCCICFVAVATYAYYIGAKYLLLPMKAQNFTYITNETDETAAFVEAYSWLPMTFLILAAFLSYIGARVLPWILTGEVYNNEIRAGASGLSGTIAYVFGFIANKTFFSLVGKLTLPGLFTFNACVALIGIVLLYVFLPETEGKSLSEIDDHFKGIKRLTNSVRRKRKTSNSNMTNGKVNDGFTLDNFDKGGNAVTHM